jgi:hypothetical protein
VPEVEHVLKEAPYLLTDANRRGYGVRCSCGWRSPLLDTSEDALAAGSEHVTEAERTDKEAEAAGFFARFRNRRRQRPPWEERRRD